MPQFTVEVRRFEIFCTAMWGLLILVGLRMGRSYGSVSPPVAVAAGTTSSDVPKDESDSGSSGVPGEKVPPGDVGPAESDLGYELGDYSPGPSSDECPFAHEDRKEYLWHLNEEVQSWDRYQAELREQASMAANDSIR